MTTVARKHLRAENEVRPLLEAAARVDPRIVLTFPRPLEEILTAAFPKVAVERVEGLTRLMVKNILWRGYRRRYHPDSDEPLSGFTYAARDLVVVFVETKHGPADAMFTLAHEMGHLAKEFLPSLVDGKRQLDLFPLTCAATTFLHGDPPVNLGAAAGVARPPQDASADRAAWLREVVANTCAAELLAPYEEVSKLVNGLSSAADCAAVLVQRFGLPRRAAEVRLLELGLHREQAAFSPALL